MSAVRVVLRSLAASVVLATGAFADSTAVGAADPADVYSQAVRDASQLRSRGIYVERPHGGRERAVRDASPVRIAPGVAAHHGAHGFQPATGPPASGSPSPEQSDAGPPAEHPLTGTALEYVWPVHGTVIDPFRMPEHPYGPGNRGLEFATQPGSAFWAAAHGVVSFAGQVGGRLHVTVTHPDGLRVSYSGVADIAVAKAQRVRQGQTLGTTADRLHVGVRRGSAYIDPALVFGGSHAEGRQSGRPGSAPMLRLGRPRLVPATVPVYRLQLRWLHSAAGNALPRAGS